MQTFKTARTRITVILLTLALIIPSIVGIILANGKSKSAIAADVSKTTFTLQEELSKIAYTDEELAASGWDGSSRDANKRALFQTAFEKSQLKFYVAPYQTGHTQREFYTWANDGSSWYLSYTSINGMCAGNSGTTGNGISTASNGFTIYSDANKLVWSIAYVAPSDGILVIPEHTLSVGWFGGSATAFQLGWSSDNGNRKTMSNTDSSLNWNTYSTGSYTIKAQTYNLKAGQTVYLNMFTVGASTNNIKYNPTFEFTTVKYEVGSETITLTEEIAKVGYTDEEKIASGWDGTSNDDNKKALFQTAFAKSKLKYYAGAHAGDANYYNVYEYQNWLSNGNRWIFSYSAINGLGVGSNAGTSYGLKASGTHDIGGASSNYLQTYIVEYTAPTAGTLTVPATDLTVNSFGNGVTAINIGITKGSYIMPNATSPAWTVSYTEVGSYTVAEQRFDVVAGDKIYITMNSTRSGANAAKITYDPQFVFVESKLIKTSLCNEIGKVAYTDDELAASGWDGSANNNTNRMALLKLASEKSVLKYYAFAGSESSYKTYEYYEWAGSGSGYFMNYSTLNTIYVWSKDTNYGLHATGNHRIGGSNAQNQCWVVAWTAPTDGILTIPESVLNVKAFNGSATNFKFGWTKGNYITPWDSNPTWDTYDTTGLYTIKEQTFTVSAGEVVYLNMHTPITSNGSYTDINYAPQYIFEPTSIPAEGEFTGASISTASDFGLNFYANVDTAGTVKATAECGDDVKTLTGKYDAFAASWKFTYPVAAKDFDKDVKVTISEIDGVAVENGDSATYSVSKYIDYVLADETGAYDDVKELVANLKEYCDAAQSYFADSEVVKVTDGVVSSSDLTDYDATVTGEDANVVIQGATLILESKTTINVYFTAPDNTTVCKVNGNEVVATKIDGVENLYVVSVEVVAKDLGVAQVFEIGGYTVNYSAYTYIGTCVDTASDALYNVLQALYDYGVSAYEYSLLG